MGTDSLLTNKRSSPNYKVQICCDRIWNAHIEYCVVLSFKTKTQKKKKDIWDEYIPKLYTLYVLSFVQQSLTQVHYLKH